MTAIKRDQAPEIFCFLIDRIDCHYEMKKMKRREREQHVKLLNIERAIGGGVLQLHKQLSSFSLFLGCPQGN